MTGRRASTDVALYAESSVFGGGERIAADLLGALDPGLEVVLVGVHAPLLERMAASRPGVEVVVLDPVRGKRDARGIAAHLRAVRAIRPRVLHSSLRTPWSCQYADLAGRLTPGVRTIAWHHSIRPARNHRQRALNRLLLSGVDANVAVSERQAEILERTIGLPAGSMRVIHNGVADEAVAPVERVAEGPVIGCVGRLSEEKAQDVLLEALPHLEGVTLTLVGDGPDRLALEARADRLGVAERVVFAGEVANARAWIAMLDVLVVPSRREALPLTCVEAMLARRPVVATEVGGIPDAVVDGATGLLVPPDDPVAIAAALRGLLADPDRAARLGEAGRARALERFSLEGMVRRFEALYGELER